MQQLFAQCLNPNSISPNYKKSRPKIPQSSTSPSRWGNDRFALEAARLAWDERSQRGYELRDLLLHHMRFAFRDDAILAKRVSAIAEGTGHADMVQDLADLSELGESCTDILAAVGVEPALIDEAAQLADELGTLLAGATEEKMLGNSLRILRDQAYTHLKGAVDKIREHGQYVFWKDPIRLEGYHSQYQRKLNTRRNDIPAIQPAPKPPTPDWHHPASPARSLLQNVGTC